MPMVLELGGCAWQVASGIGPLGEPVKLLLFQDPQSGWVVQTALSQEVANEIAAALRGITIAGQMPNGSPPA